MKTESLDSGKYRILSEINMIPFIDVALVLLIIFMIMTPVLMKSQLKLVVPDSKAADQQDPKDRTIDIQVRSDGAVFMDGKMLNDEDIGDAIKARVTDPATQGIVIEADKDVQFQRVVDVMGAAKKLGLVKMAVCVTEERERGAGRLK
ncbi:MAG: biopolymer transporter ExbD [bacterium]